MTTRVYFAAAAAIALLLPTLLPVTVTAQDTGAAGLGSGPPDKRFAGRISLLIGYDDNVFTTNTDEQESAFNTLSGSISYSFGTPRSSVAINAGARTTVYWDRPDDELDWAANLGISATHNLSERINLFASTSLVYENEPDFGSVFTTSRRDGNYFVSNTNIGASIQLTERLSKVGTLGFSTVFYEDDEISSFFDRLEYFASASLVYQVLPTTSAVLEYRIRFFDQEDETQDAFSQYILAGFNHRFNPRASWTFRGGVEIREFDFGGDTATNPFFSSDISYVVSDKTTASWNTRLGYEVSDTVGVLERYTFRTGLNISHRLTGRIQTNLGLFYSHDEFEDDVDFDDDTFNLSVSASYAFSRHWGITAGYTYTILTSDIDVREYDRNVFNAGLQFYF